MNVTPFERLGGAQTVDRLVEAFYANMDSMDEARGIRAMHGASLAPVKHVLKTYLSEWLGGPKNYSAVKGHPRLRMRHMRFSIGPAERDAWLSCMKTALAEVVEDEKLREALYGEFQKLADWMRNDPECPHDRRA